jgi:hypothetical protein
MSTSFSTDVDFNRISNIPSIAWAVIADNTFSYNLKITKNSKC